MSVLADLLDAHRDDALLALLGPGHDGANRRHAAGLLDAVAAGLRAPEATAPLGLLPPPGALDLAARVRLYGRVQRVVLELARRPGAAGLAADEVERLARLCHEAVERAVDAHAAEAASRLDEVLREAPVAVALHEPPGHTYTFANAAYRALVGGRDVVGKPLFDALPEIRGQGYDVLFDRVLATGETVFGHEQRAKLERGGRLEDAWFTYVFVPRRDGEGRVVGVLEYAYEVTAQVVARREVEGLLERLHRSDERLRRVVEASGAGTWEVDLTTQTTVADSQHQQLVVPGTARSGSFAERVATLVAAEDRARITEAFAAAARGEADGELRCEFRTNATPQRWLEVRGKATFDATGRATAIAGTSVDVTARKVVESEREALLVRAHHAQAEAELERTKLHDVFMQAPFPIAMLEGRDYVFTFANPSYRELVGGRDVVGRPCFEVLPDVRDQGFDGLLAQVFREGRPFVGRELPVHLAHHGADERSYLDVTYTPMRDPSGTVTGILASHVDVTAQVVARRRVEALAAALQTSEQRLREVLEAAGAGSWDLDASTGEIASDARMRELMGLAPDVPFTVDTGLAHLHPDDRDRVAHALTAALAGENGGRYETEFRSLRQDGEGVRWVESRAHALFDAQGKGVRLAGVMVDVTARKEAEAAQTALLESIADQAVFGVALVRGADLRFELVNPGYRAIVGGRDVVGQPMLDALPELRGQGVDASFREIMRTGRAMTFLEQPYLVDATGSGVPETRYYNFIWQPVAQPGKPADAILVITHDVTESVRVRAQEQGLRTQAEEANRLKDEFLAVVSHELRTPLTAMLGWAQMLRMGQLDAARTAHAHEIIERNALVQRQLIEDLLDVARITSGKLVLELSTVSFSPPIEAALEAVRPAAEARDIALHVMLDPSVAVRGDGARLQQIAWNLLTNAVKFTPRGGHVTVLLLPSESSAELVVTDSGQGITADFLPHVFERFRQADATSTRRYGGLGLGLSIVKHLVELHGGTIVAESRGLGHGAVFTVRLPIAALRRSDAPPALFGIEPPPAPAKPPELVGQKVLVVEDDDDTRELLVALLHDCDVDVAAAASAADALAKLGTFQPDLVLSDVGMAGQDGYAFVQELRSREARTGTRTPVVALTAFAHTSDRTRALRAGFTAHVAKPVEPSELLAVLAALAPVRRTG